MEASLRQFPYRGIPCQTTDLYEIRRHRSLATSRNTGSKHLQRCYRTVHESVG